MNPKIARADVQRPDTQLKNDKAYFFYEDHIGRIVLISEYRDDTNDNSYYQDNNEYACPYWQAAYKAFGQVYCHGYWTAYSNMGITIGSGSTGITWDMPFRFPGQYEDPELAGEIVYNWNRYYMPRVGRYAEADPIDISFSGLSFRPIGKINHLFPYSSNNPIMLIDPSGLATYKGVCVYVSGGLVGGVGYLDCDVYGQCGQNHKQQAGRLRAFFAGATAGLLVGGVGYALEQSDGFSGAGDIRNMTGSATLATASGAVGIGYYLYTLRLGNTVSTSEKYGAVQEGAQAGLDLSADLFYGYSWLSGDVKEECCKIPGRWR